MKRKFRIKIKVGNSLLLIIFAIAFIYSYIYVIDNTSIKDFMINETIKRFDNTLIEHENFTRTKMVYNTLNKVVDYDELDTQISLDDIPDVYYEVYENDVIESEPIFYIYNSHQTESYSEPFISDYSAPPTVLMASHILKEYLSEYEYSSIVEKRSMKEYLTENGLQYKDSYEASRYYAEDTLKLNNSVKYIIDLHRDSVGYKKTLYEKDDVKYARVMFVVGTNHKNYEKNLSFAEEINSLLNKHYKGISRGIYIRKDARFNQDLSEKSILIELGGVDNSLEEVNNTLSVIAFVLNEYIKESDDGK